jgi:hypothetical protein
MEMVRVTGAGRSTIIQYRELVYLYHSDLKENEKEEKISANSVRKSFLFCCDINVALLVTQNAIFTFKESNPRLWKGIFTFKESDSRL